MTCTFPPRVVGACARPRPRSLTKHALSRHARSDIDVIAPLVRKAHRGASSRLGSRRHLIRMSAQPATAGSGAPLSSTPHPLTASLTAWTVRGRTSASDNTRGERFSHLLALAPGAACAPLIGVTRHSKPRCFSGSGEAGNCLPQKGAHKLRTV